LVHISYYNISICLFFRDEKNKYHILLTEYHSYKRSSQVECHKNEELLHFFNKFTQNHINTQNEFKTCLENFNYLKDKYFNILKMTEIQNKNLDEVIIVCISQLHNIKYIQF